MNCPLSAKVKTVILHERLFWSAFLFKVDERQKQTGTVSYFYVIQSNSKDLTLCFQIAKAKVLQTC